MAALARALWCTPHARWAAPGDIVIVAAFAQIEEAAARRHSPAVVHVDAHNRQRHGFPLRQAV